MPDSLPLALPQGVACQPPMSGAQAHILTAEAVAFVADLARSFQPRVGALLAARAARQGRLDAGERLSFRSDTAEVRAGTWTVVPPAADLTDRRVEITGPPERKMVINALNSGARVFMADFEDSCAPTWANLVAGQANLFDAVRRTIAVDDPARGRSYRLAAKTATLMVRPRGWHLSEPGLTVDGQAVPGALFDFGLFFFHNARELAARGSGPYFYLPKLEACEEARLWDDVFRHAQARLQLPVGTIRATVLIETLPAAFEMDEILHALRDHSAGLNCGRWDYIFSFIKCRRADPEALLPDRAQVGMTQPCMRAYSQLLVRTCHRRGAHAMGGMAAQIPIKGDAARNEAALQSVRRDKLREVQDGHDGTWVAHPGLVGLATEVFDAHMAAPHQIDRPRPDVSVGAEDLLQTPRGERSEAGLRGNIEVGVRYLAAWLGGNGCVPIHHLMEDAATAEISRTQVWQWLRHGALLADGRRVDRALVARLLDEELQAMRAAAGPSPRAAPATLEAAGALFAQMCWNSVLPNFITEAAVAQLRASHQEASL